MTVELYDYQVAQLVQYKAQFGIADTGKTIRTALDYAIVDGDEKLIFFTPASCDCGSH